MLFLAVVVLSRVGVATQEKTLSETEFNNVWKRACEKVKGVPHIDTETNEEYSDDAKPPFYTYIRLTRYIPLDRVWVIAGPKDSDLAKKYEEIRIGRKSYSRDGVGSWKFQELGFTGRYDCEPEPSLSTGKGNGTGHVSDGKSSLMRFEYEYRYMGRKDLSEIYVRTKRMIITTEGNQSQTTFKYSIWLNSDGTYLKTEAETRSSDTQRWSRSMSVYDYTTKDLKIEAPIK